MEVIMIIVSLIAGFLLSAILGKFLIPALVALKAGQSIKEIGPTWHNNKAGTPTMGGLMFIAASVLCAATGWFAYAEGNYPYIAATPMAGVPHELEFGIRGFSPTGFEVFAYSPSYSGTITFNWIACL